MFPWQCRSFSSFGLTANCSKAEVFSVQPARSSGSIFMWANSHSSMQIYVTENLAKKLSRYILHQACLRRPIVLRLSAVLYTQCSVTDSAPNQWQGAAPISVHPDNRVYQLASFWDDVRIGSAIWRQVYILIRTCGRVGSKSVRVRYYYSGPYTVYTRIMHCKTSTVNIESTMRERERERESYVVDWIKRMNRNTISLS